MMINCREATRLSSDALERPLSPGERFSLVFHRLICPPCRRFGEQMNALRNIARSYAKGANPDGADDVL